MKRLAITFLLAALAAVGGGVVAAEMQSKSVVAKLAVLKTGEYSNLTLWRQLKLGTAPYVNPGLLNRVEIVYRYDVVSFNKGLNKKQIDDLLRSGIMGIAKYSRGSYIVSPASEAIREMGISASNLVYVSHSPGLSGKKPVGKIISWDAKFPVVEPIPEKESAPESSGQ